MELVLSPELAVSRQLIENSKAIIAASKKLVEHSYKIIEESHRVLDKAQRIPKQTPHSALSGRSAGGGLKLVLVLEFGQLPSYSLPPLEQFETLIRSQIQELDTVSGPNHHPKDLQPEFAAAILHSLALLQDSRRLIEEYCQLIDRSLQQIEKSRGLIAMANPARL